MNSGATKPRGTVAPGKRQVNWRIKDNLLKKLDEERRAKKIKSRPAMVEHILTVRYYPEPIVK